MAWFEVSALFGAIGIVGAFVENRGIVRSPQKIVQGDLKIIGESNERLVICLSFFVFISADGVLIHVKIQCQL